MRILGIDPAISNTGWGIIEHGSQGPTYVASGTIKTNPKDNLASRLGVISINFQEIIQFYHPERAIIEEVYVNNNPQSSMKLCHARGAIMAIIATTHTPKLENIELLEVSPRLVKKSVVGTGAATKEQIQHMIKLLIKGAKFKSADEADSLAMAYYASLNTNKLNANKFQFS